MLGREPRQFGLERTRWRLGDVLAQLAGWHLHGPPSLSRLLRRLRISFQQGRAHVYSPDLNYQPKRQEVQTRELAAHLAALEAGWDDWRPPAVLHVPRRQVTLLQDELTYYRQPTLARAYAPQGRDVSGQAHPPLAALSYQANTVTRVAATLDVISGQVVWRQHSRIGVAELVALYQDVRTAYPDAERIWVIQDNWPVHWHADLLAAWSRRRPAGRPGARPTGLTSRAGTPNGSGATSSCRSSWSSCRPTRRGSTQLRSCGAGSNRRSCTCIGWPMTCRRCGHRWRRS